MIFNKFYLAILCSSLLVACGGGGSSTSSGTTTPTATAATSTPTTVAATSVTTTSSYTGKRELASINSSNQRIFIDGMRASIVDALGSMNSKNIRDVLNTYSVNVDMRCLKSGTLKMTGDVSTIINTGKGTLQITHDQCNDGTTIINGNFSIKVNEINAATRSLIDFDVIPLNATITNSNGVASTVNGTKQVKTGNLQDTVVSNITYKGLNGGQTLDNLKFVMNYINSSTADQATSGQFCEENNGCVNIITPIAYLFQLNQSGFAQGQSILTGAANSKTRLEAVGGIFWMSLDANGDGIYETTTQY